MSRGKILVVDDDKLTRWSLNEALTNVDYDVAVAKTGSSCLDAIADDLPDLVLLDLMLPDMLGIDILKQIQAQGGRTTVVMMTAHDGIELAVQAMKLGAYDYLSKPLDMSALVRVVEKATESSRLRNEVARLRAAEGNRFGIEKIAAQSPAMQPVCDTIKKMAASDATTVLLEGESGTGKDLIAGTIHYTSRRAEKPFVAINCAALPETLLESELFGYEKGAFTGAKTSKKGLLEVADGGTVLLDEIGDMQLSAQVKLLRAIENKMFRRLGGTKNIKTDIRVIAASNQDLQKHMREGRFREDLYYRLKVVSIRVPSLRERKEDIPRLAQFFIHEFNAQLGRNVREVSDEAMELLLQYDWPGNVREFKNVIERAMLLGNAPTIYPDCFPPEMRGGKSRAAAGISERFTIPPEGLSLQEFEDELIRRALELSSGNKSRAARLLGMSRDALRYRLKKLQPTSHK
jgi:DNA-binding NtrC family response regulator